MAYSYKKRLKNHTSKIFSDSNLKKYGDWSITYKAQKEGYRAREIQINLIPKKNKN